ncbi:Cbs2p [Saccharomyces eubayanus]|uniref:Cbs2p n=1 Tax=Saccharomyces eubayanus TaxID=1080349 RepID=UPI0006C4B5F7|nr:CBS2-like protein [Saccharomyces eubayanus]KOH01038.1 CBS2-like protein [Saccharomyces eubayanus]
MSSPIPRVYSLGNSPMSYLLALRIAQLPSQPKVPLVVLLLNDQKKLNRFLDNDSKIIVKSNNNNKEIHHRQFMASCVPPILNNGEIAPIENLIISDKSSKFITAQLSKYSKSLTPETNILLLNPSLNLLEYMHRYRWRSAQTRPNLFMGFTSPVEVGTIHQEFQLSIDTKKRIQFHLAKIDDFPSLGGAGRNTDLPLIGDRPTNEKETPFNKLFKEMAKLRPRIGSRLINFDLHVHSFHDLFFVALENLMLESSIEPLLAVYDCTYKKELLKIAGAQDTIHKLINEQLFVIDQSYPSLKNYPNYSIIFEKERIFNLIMRDLKVNGNKRAKLARSLEQLNHTNIDELNGYFVALAKYKKCDCRWNEMILTLVKGKQSITKQKALDYHYL